MLLNYIKTYRPTCMDTESDPKSRLSKHYPQLTLLKKKKKKKKKKKPGFGFTSPNRAQYFYMELCDCL